MSAGRAATLAFARFAAGGTGTRDAHTYHTALCVGAAGPSGDTQSSESYADSDVESGASSEDAWVDSEGAVVVGVCG